MRRRALLGVFGWFASLAGCGTRGQPEASATSSADPVGSHSGVDLPVSESVLTRSSRRDDIPAITDPAFGEDWRGLELEVMSELGERYLTRPRLVEGDLVVGLKFKGDARAYPIKVLQFHEVVNDSLGGPLLVTYCPLCRSAMTASRQVQGQPTRFGVDGRLWRGNLLLYDELTGSLWSQIEATAIRGPATGQQLALRPATLTTWGNWRWNQPETAVLLPPPYSGTVAGGDLVVRDYASNPYSPYDDSAWVPAGAATDNRLHPKTLVIGVSVEGAAAAYPLPIVSEADVIHDVVGDQPIVVTATQNSIAAYFRRVSGEVVTFEPAGPRHLRARGSRWNRSTGHAIDGPHHGTTLERANRLSPMFWFAWLSHRPETRLFTG